MKAETNESRIMDPSACLEYLASKVKKRDEPDKLSILLDSYLVCGEAMHLNDAANAIGPTVSCKVLQDLETYYGEHYERYVKNVPESELTQDQLFTISMMECIRTIWYYRARANA